MNVLYTLYCEHGVMLHSKAHFLLLGSWVCPDPGKYVVLVHGTLSRMEYYELCTRYKIPMYNYPTVNWTDIKPYQENAMWKPLPVGWLMRIGEQMYKGILVNNGFIF